jgi:C-terminal peptidase prc
MTLRRLILLSLVVFSLACNFLTKAVGALVAPPTPTVTALAPAYVPEGCEAALVATVPAATQLALPTPSLQGDPSISPTDQLRVFDEAVKIITRVYIYPDFNGMDWSAISAAHRAKTAGGLDTEAFYTQMTSMLGELGDDHSYFESPAEVAQSEAELAGTSEYVGIGVSVLPDLDAGTLSVVAVFPDSPAARAGIKPHDRILSIDGLPLIENGEAHLYRVRGPACSALRLTVQSPKEAPRDVLLLRHKIRGDLPIDVRTVPTTDGSTVGYIMLPSFYDETIPRQVAAALQAFGTLDGLILDNRENAGGSSDILESVLAYFVSGTLGHFKSRTAARPLQIEPNPIGNSQTVPLVVLVGKDTVSFGEISSGVLKDSGRAKIVGQTTLGNVEILHGYNFDDGSRLWIAEETFDPGVSHANWEVTGIVPDVEAYAAWDTFTFETDPSLQAALTLLRKRP